MPLRRIRYVVLGCLDRRIADALNAGPCRDWERTGPVFAGRSDDLLAIVLPRAIAPDAAERT